MRAAGVSAGMPFSNDYMTSMSIEGRPIAPAADRPSVNYYGVSAGFFEAMGIRLVRGRLLAEHDSAEAPRVAVINETLARQFFAGEEPIGRRIQVGMGSEAWCEVVGVVADTRQYNLRGDTTPQFYQPYAQQPFSGMTLVVRTDRDPASVASALREAVRAIDPAVPVGQVRALEEVLGQATARGALLNGPPGGLRRIGAPALGHRNLRAAAYSVGQRRIEVGVRMAHGAKPRQVLWMFVREGIGLGLLGAAIGLPAARALSRLVASLLFGVEPTDPATLSLVFASLVAAAALASLVPAYRAMRTDVVGALRAE